MFKALSGITTHSVPLLTARNHISVTQTTHGSLMLFQCLPSNADDRTALKQHWFIVSCYWAVIQTINP